MGMIGRFLGALFGGGASEIRKTVEVFRPNAEAADTRDHDRYLAALAQLAAETAAPGWFGAFVDGLNRLPRPAMAFGVIALFAYCMAEPEEFGIRMAALALVPPELWWLLGAVVSFYFGVREMAKRREIRATEAISNLKAYSEAVSEVAPPPDPDMAMSTENPALAEFLSGARSK